MRPDLADTLLELRGKFKDDLRLRGYSALTIESYGQDLGHLFDWLATQPKVQSLEHITTSVLRDFQIHLMMEPRKDPRHKTARILTAATRNRHLAAIKSFFRYLRQSGQLFANPAAELESARAPKKLPKDIPTPEEMLRLLEVIAPTSDVARHDRAVFEVFYSCGLRRRECLGLKLGQLRLEESLLQVLGKGNKDRVVPLGPQALQALSCYLQEVRPRWARPDCQHVFVSKLHGRGYRGNELLVRLRRYARQAELDKDITFHTFRHACATHLLQGKADLRAIQLLLGHEGLDVTALYLHLDVSHLREVILKHHPRENPEGWDDDFHE